MTNPIPQDASTPRPPDALDPWWNEHGGGPRYIALNGQIIDNALNTFSAFKTMQAQGRAPDGYDLDNPALIDAAKIAQTDSDGRYADSLQHGGQSRDNWREPAAPIPQPIEKPVEQAPTPPAPPPFTPKRIGPDGLIVPKPHVMPPPKLGFWAHVFSYFKKS